MNFKFSPNKKMMNNKFSNSFTLKYRLETKYPNKPGYNSVIPLKIFQTWHTKNLPPNMKTAVEIVKKTNPKFEHHLFDDDDCREFIKNNFPEAILQAYDGLIPGAYKADLWRYCVLYKEGGIYIDIKYIPHNNFRFITLTEREHFVLDTNGNDVYNALMACKPGNLILFQAINRIVRNVKTKYYGEMSLEPTGPRLLSKIIPNHIKRIILLKHEAHNNQKFISFNGIIILKMYYRYYEEMHKNEKTSHYGVLWPQRKIYA